MSKTPEDELLRCSFCNKSQREVKKLIAGPTVFICDECVDICFDIITEDRLLELPGKLMSAEEIEKELDLHVVGQAQAKRSLALALRNHLARQEVAEAQQNDGPRFKKNNLLLVGPRGTGKTQTVRCLANVLKTPWAVIDAPRLTGLSYFKEENLLEILYRSANNDLSLAESGVICIDQLDRIAYRGGADDPGRRIQESLLEVLEGTTVTVQMEKSSVQIDTSGILVVGCGSFSDEAGKPFRHPRRDELVRYGFLPELIDRFGLIVEFEPLSETDLASLLTRPKGLLDEYKALFRVDSIELAFSDNAIQAIAREAYRRGGGARGLRAILESVALELSLELASKPRPADFTVDETFVNRSL